MKENQYTRCYVAFLDILGFKNLVSENSCQDILKIYQKFNNPLKGIVYKDRLSNIYLIEGINSIKTKVMSDSICFYIEANVPNALLCLLASCAAMQKNFLELMPPILIRGAIVIGDIYASEDITFGPALTSAYLLEEKNAKYPRIIITKQTLEEGKNTLKRDKNILDIFKTLTFRDFDGFYAIDIMNFFRFAPDEKLNRLTQHIFNILDRTTDSSERDKYLYLEKLLKKEKDSIG